MEGLCQTYFWKRHHMWPPVPCTNYTIRGESLFYVETLVFSILSIGCYSPSILLIYRLYYQAAYPWTLTEKHFEYNFIAITKCRFTNVSFSSGKWTLEKVNGIIYHYFSTMSSLISSAIYVCKNNCSPCWTTEIHLYKNWTEQNWQRLHFERGHIYKKTKYVISCCLLCLPIPLKPSEGETLLRVRVMVINANFNNISVILWMSVLFLEENQATGENHRPASSHWQTL